MSPGSGRSAVRAVGTGAEGVAQDPAWPNPGAVSDVRAVLSSLPALVSEEECLQLREHLAAASRGEAFVLQGGDCAETFGGSTADVIAKARTLLGMRAVLASGCGRPVIVIGRMAGQYAKPRSAPTETVANVTLPSYRGDSVNGAAFRRSSRTPDPRRMVQMYRESARTLDVLRDFAEPESRDTALACARAMEWFDCASPERGRYEAPTGDLTRGVSAPTGIQTPFAPSSPIFTSHEALILDYEEPLVRTSARGERSYSGSAHLLWVGERTRDPNGAHVAFAARIGNPVAVKLGPTATPTDVDTLIRRLDPDGVPGRLTLIARLGAAWVRRRLPELVEAARGAPVVWLCDPMHGNTVSDNGRKTRHLPDILDEIDGFFEVHRRLGSHAGGLHIEMTGADVTECVGGGHPVSPEDLHRRYETACDPRLNRNQSLDVAFHVAETMLAERRITGAL